MKGKTGFVSIISLLIAFSLLTFSFAVADLMSDGGNRLVDLQADITADNAGNGLYDIDPDDGGWDWEILPSETEHSENPSPENLFGVTGDGVLASFQDGGGIRLAISLVDSYYGISGNPDIDSGTDFGFLCRLSDLTGDSSYAKLAKERWDTKMALYGGADSLAILIKESRHSSGYDGLIPWDIGLYIKDGLKLQEYFPGQGYLSDAIDMADVIYGDLTSEEPYFDMYDGYEWFYTFGLEGIVSSFGLLGIYYDYAFNSGVILLENQNIDGGWGWNEEYPESDAQATAYVVMSFGMLDVPYRPVNNAAQAGSDYLASIQAANGGWDLFGYEYPEVDGECLRAMSFYSPTLNLSQHGSSGSSEHAKMMQRSESLSVARPWSR